MLKHSKFVYIVPGSGLVRMFTWNTVSRALVIVSKFEVGRPSGKLKLPPNSCIPSKANIKINRNSSSNSDRMDDMALVKATTRLRSEDQYLKIYLFIHTGNNL